MKVLLWSLLLVAPSLAVPAQQSGAVAPRVVYVQAAASSAGAPSAQISVQAALKEALSRPAPEEVPRAAVDALSFKADPAVTERERQRTIEHLSGQPGAGGPATAAIRSGALWREFDDLLRRYGYSSQNLGDVLAAHLVISWEIVNGRDSTQVPRGQRAVRRQLLGPLSRVETIAGMDDAGKQAQAERTAYMTMIAAAAYQELKDGRDPAQLESLQRNLRESVKRSGPDLERLELTDGGLIQR
jgi:hypothetical protein